MKEYKNKLVIIVNGFDLAHGLPTSYGHFIKWYLVSICEKMKKSFQQYDDKLINVKLKNLSRDMHSFQMLKKDDTKIEWFFESDSSDKIFEIEYKSQFFRKLLNEMKSFSWVDIESEYYKSLIEIYDDVKGSRVVFIGTEKEYFESEVRKLNIDFEFFKNKLEEYLNTIDCKTIDNKQDINNLFSSEYIIGYHKEENPKLMHYLNFNYTETIEKYIWPQSNYQLNYIHGLLNNQDNPIIFGYGDEIDKYYEEIQNLNINDFLNNFKSFGYFKTENYSNLLHFIESESFDVDILGHSCGLSDRVLLNTIFEHDNCESIKIHYYQKSEAENDFLSKTQEISRHFKDKAKMRKRIVNFKDCKPLVKFQK